MSLRKTSPLITATTVTKEVDEFNVALPQMEGALSSSGAGEGSSRVTVRAHDEVVLGHIDIGFPMVGNVDVHESAVVIAIALAAPPGSRWDGEDLSSGQAFLYPGGGHHQAIDPAGFEVGFLVIDHGALERSIEHLGRKKTSLHQGRLDDLAARQIVSAYLAATDSGDVTEILAAVALASSERVEETTRRLHSREIVHRAVDHVEETGEWRPSILTLCRATGVSERRLQMAFQDIYATTPTRFLRQRAISSAKMRLKSSMDLESPVTHVAYELGFTHLSRFSHYYFAQHGEHPSETVRRLGGE